MWKMEGDDLYERSLEKDRRTEKDSKVYLNSTNKQLQQKHM